MAVFPVGRESRPIRRLTAETSQSEPQFQLKLRLTSRTSLKVLVAGSLPLVITFGGMAQNEFSVSSSVVVQAPPEAVFAVLADPSKHSVIDGSGSVQGQMSGPERLVLGSKFGMRMRAGLGYRVTNTVVEYEENRLIAWRHVMPGRWRYELEPEGDSATRVTESYDYSAMLPKLLSRTGLHKQRRSIEATLQRLKSYVEDQTEPA